MDPNKMRDVMAMTKCCLSKWSIALFPMLALVFAALPLHAAESGNMLRIRSVDPGPSAPGFVFSVVEVTDDSGQDGEPDTGDEGENDGYPDPGEALESLTSDTISITLRNEPRPGVEGQLNGGRPLEVDRIVLTYFDSTGSTPAYAPQASIPTAWEVAPNEERTVELVAVPYRMKVPANASIRGLRDMFLFPVDATEFAAAQTLRVHISVHAVDEENSDTSGDTAEVVFSFINPNVGGGL